MKRQEHMTAFYLETVLMVIIFALVIAVLAQVFASARMQSREARQLTNAVCLAQNAAEAVKAASDSRDLLALMNEDGNASLEEGNREAVLTAWYDEDMKPLALADAPAKAGSPGGNALRLEATWAPAEETDAGEKASGASAGTEKSAETPDSAEQASEAPAAGENASEAPAAGDGQGRLIASRIAVYDGSGDEAIYTLQAGAYLREEGVAK